MERVTGIGGIFFRARDPERLRNWYRDLLGVNLEPWGGAVFKWQEPSEPARAGMTVWNTFPADTRYFDPSTASFMVNYRVADLDAMLAQLGREGVEVIGHEHSEFGRFAWVLDPEGNKVELWEPPVGE